jgi:hypothetical protein
MESQYREKLRSMDMLLLPGARYVVSAEFQDADGLLHPTGESWVYLGCQYRKLFGGYIIYIEGEHGKEISFRMAHRRVCSDPPTVLDELQNYLVGPDAPSGEIISSLSAKSQASLARVRQWVQPIPETAIGLMYALERARGNARTAEDRGGGGYEQVVQDLGSVLSDVYILVSKLPPNNSFQRTRYARR